MLPPKITYFGYILTAISVNIEMEHDGKNADYLFTYLLSEYIHNQQLPSLILVFTEILVMHPVT